jgi:hypothetical protein
MTTIYLKHHQCGVQKEMPIGFSWTLLFFGACVPLLRGDLKWALIFTLLSLGTLGVSWFLVPFFYNGYYIKECLEKGYLPLHKADAEELDRRYHVKLSPISVSDSNEEKLL